MNTKVNTGHPPPPNLRVDVRRGPSTTIRSDNPGAGGQVSRDQYRQPPTPPPTPLPDVVWPPQPK
jgi:hypothetical protein